MQFIAPCRRRGKYLYCARATYPSNKTSAALQSDCIVKNGLMPTLAEYYATQTANGVNCGVMLLLLPGAKKSSGFFPFSAIGHHVFKCVLLELQYLILKRSTSKFNFIYVILISLRIFCNILTLNSISLKSFNKKKCFLCGFSILSSCE
jgi:hypothetical protein